jgi:aldehyde:ferredoxin oxidoreductase
MAGGYTGKIVFVDLTTSEIRTQELDPDMIRNYLGGYGLGVRILFEHQKKGADPLGPENILGFTAGTLTGTKTPASGRYMAVSKSPLTGGWGDANSGGYFGAELKAAGWDAVFVSGIASSPQYIMIADDKIEVRDAAHLWGKDAVETESALQKDLGQPKLRVATIGPASERISLISGIVNDKGRIAARSGLGAVMGAKKLKAVAVRGSGKVAVADKDTLARVRKTFLNQIREMPGMPDVLLNQGTCGFTAGLMAAGATPVKNWKHAGEQAFENVQNMRKPSYNTRRVNMDVPVARLPVAAFSRSTKANIRLEKCISPNMKPSGPSAPCVVMMISNPLLNCTICVIAVAWILFLPARCCLLAWSVLSTALFPNPIPTALH